MGINSHSLDVRFSAAQSSALARYARSQKCSLSKLARTVACRPMRRVGEHNGSHAANALILDDTLLATLLDRLIIAGTAYNLAAKDMNSYARLQRVTASDNLFAFNNSKDACMHLAQNVSSVTSTLQSITNSYEFVPLGWPSRGGLSHKCHLYLGATGFESLSANAASLGTASAEYLRAILCWLIRYGDKSPYKCVARRLTVYSFERELIRQTTNAGQIRFAARLAVDNENLCHIGQDDLATELYSALDHLHVCHVELSDAISQLRESCLDTQNGAAL